MWYSKKITRSWKRSKLNMDDAPSSYMQTHNQIKKEDKGTSKLRTRNDRLHAELADLADLHNTKVTVFKVGNKIYYTVRGLGISVCLMNS